MQQKRNFSILQDKCKKYIFHVIDINNGKCLMSLALTGKRYEIQHFFCDKKLCFMNFFKMLFIRIPLSYRESNVIRIKSLK